jgi:DNA-binding GntR family transcriptional regulator
MAPGTTIVEARVAQQLGVTRVTLRSALQRLEQDGYLHVANLGTYRRRVVTPLTIEDLEEMFELIAALEQVAVRRIRSLAASDRRGLAADLTRHNAAMLAAVRASPSDPIAAAEADARFHERITSSLAGPRLRVQLAVIRPQVGRYRRAYTAWITSGMRVGFEEHRAVIRAIRSGNPDAAAEALVHHWHEAARRFVAAIRRVGEQGVPHSTTARLTR